MLAADVVAQLQNLLPHSTELLTDVFELSGVSRAAFIATATSKATHPFLTGQDVILAGAEAHLPVTLTRVATTGDTNAIAKFTTDHDLTMDSLLKLPRGGGFNGYKKCIVISGESGTDWNGTWEVLSIPDGLTVNLVVPAYAAQDTTSAGSPVLENSARLRETINGSYTVREVTANTLKVQTAYSGDSPTPAPSGTIKAHTRPRISAAATFERAEAAYTKMTEAKLWAFVILGDADASTDRETDSDSVADQPASAGAFRQRVVQPFDVLVFFPASDSFAGAEMRDMAAQLYGPLLTSLVGTKFATGLDQETTVGLQTTGHRQHRYDGPLYVHSFGFEQTVDVLFGDTVGPANRARTVRAKSIALTIFPIEGNEPPDPFIEADEHSLTVSALSLDEG